MSETGEKCQCFLLRRTEEMINLMSGSVFESLSVGEFIFCHQDQRFEQVMNKNVVLMFCYFVHLFLYMCLITWVYLHKSESITVLINLKENTDNSNHKNT